MTLPDEEYYSLVAVKNFLYDLMNPAHIKNVPSEVRERASRLIKHFPMQHRLNELYKDHITDNRSVLKEYNNGGGWGKGKDE
jgi:hypothetical protein